MAITNVTWRSADPNSSSGTGLTSNNFNAVSTPAIFIVAAAKWEGAATTCAFSDNGGSSFTTGTIITHSNTDLNICLGWAQIGTAQTSHNVTMTLGSARSFRYLAVWTVNADSALSLEQQAAGGTNTSQGGSAGNVTTAGAAALFCAISQYSAGTFLPGTGWTEDFESQFSGEHRLVASGGTYACDGTNSNDEPWVAVGAAFKESGGAPPATSLVIPSRRNFGALLNH